MSEFITDQEKHRRATLYGIYDNYYIFRTTGGYQYACAPQDVKGYVVDQDDIDFYYLGPNYVDTSNRHQHEWVKFAVAVKKKKKSKKKSLELNEDGNVTLSNLTYHPVTTDLIYSVGTTAGYPGYDLGFQPSQVPRSIPVDTGVLSGISSIASTGGVILRTGSTMPSTTANISLGDASERQSRETLADWRRRMGIYTEPLYQHTINNISDLERERINELNALHRQQTENPYDRGVVLGPEHGVVIPPISDQAETLEEYSARTTREDRQRILDQIQAEGRAAAEETQAGRVQMLSELLENGLINSDSAERLLRSWSNDER